MNRDALFGSPRTQARNPDGSLKFDVAGDPVYTERTVATDTVLKPEGVRATNADGSPKFNEKGEPVYVEGTVIETPTIETLNRRLSELEARFKRG